MRVRTGVLLIAAVLAGGCWPFKGGGKPPAPTAAPLLENSPRTVDSLWLAGQRAFNRGRWNDANRIFTRLGAAMQATDPRQTRMAFFKGEIEMALGNELDAVRQFRRIADETPDDSLAPHALLRAGDAYGLLWKRPELDPTYGTTALAVYQEVLGRYPNGAVAARAAARVVQLQDRFAEKEYLSALYYYRYKAYESAILVLRSVVSQYPKSEVAPLALEKLVLSFRALGYQEDVKEICAYIVQVHPSPTGPRRFCPAPAVDSAAAK